MRWVRSASAERWADRPSPSVHSGLPVPGASHAHALVAALTLLAGAAAPASAQLSEKEAIQQVKDASKAQPKAFKQNAAAALTTLDANLQTVEGLLTEGSDAATVGSQVASMAIVYMTSLNDAAASAKAFVEASATLALESLADGGDLQGLFPDDFSYGGGGVLDKHRAALTKAGSKSRDAATKRIAKAAAKAEKVANIAIQSELRFPTRNVPAAVNQGDSVGLAQTATIDIIVAASDLDSGNDGLLAFGGSTGTDGTGVDVTYFTVGINESDETSPVDGRWAIVFQGLHEGGYVVSAKQATDGTFHSVGEIGVR